MEGAITVFIPPKKEGEEKRASRAHRKSSNEKVELLREKTKDDIRVTMYHPRLVASHLSAKPVAYLRYSFVLRTIEFSHII